MSDLTHIGQQAHEEFAGKNAAREEALRSARDSIRASANAIRAVHRGEMNEAARLLAESRRLLGQAHAATVEHLDIRHAGFVTDAEKEHAEAALTTAFVQERPLPLAHDLGVGMAAYLNGLGEVVGELRRELLDRLRRGDVPKAELAMTQMEDIYELLVTVDYPDAMTGGLRRTTDAARAIVERSRSDLTTTIVQQRLIDRLDR